MWELHTDMDALSVLKKSYRLLENVTPLKEDCGKICNNCCCRGDEKTGMILFPREEVLIGNSFEYKIIDYDFLSDKKLLVCNAECDRNFRPLSCRIFPLFPLTVNGKIYVIRDPRGEICPLINDDYIMNRKFYRRVKSVGKLLLKNDETKRMSEMISSEIIAEYFTAKTDN